jgi:hypothetical protein
MGVKIQVGSVVSIPLPASGLSVWSSDATILTAVSQGGNLVLTAIAPGTCKLAAAGVAADATGFADLAVEVVTAVVPAAKKA